MTAPRVWWLSPFRNEVDVLAARLELWAEDPPDGVVSVEHVVQIADHTHQGEPAGDLFERNANLYQALQEAGVDAGGVHILGVHLDPEPKGDEANWARERRQRDAILGSDLADKVEPHDLVLCTDVDEIVDPAIVPHLLRVTSGGYRARLGMRMLFFDARWELPAGWFHAYAFRWRDRPTSLSAARTGQEGTYPLVENAGYHCSWNGGDAGRQAKIDAFAHAEFRDDDARIHMADAATVGVGPNGENLVPVDVDTLPRAIRKHVWRPDAT